MSGWTGLNGFRFTFSQVIAIATTCILATWTVFAFLQSSERRLERLALDQEKRSVVLYVRKEQFEELKNRFNRLEDNVLMLQADVVLTKAGVLFLVEKAGK